MTISKKAVLTELWHLFLFFLVSLIQSYFMCPRCNTVESFFSILLFTFLMWIMLWKGNAFLSDKLFKNITWIEYPLKRFALGMLVTISYTVVAIIVLIEIFERYSSIVFGDKYLYTMYGSIFVTIVISFFLHARQFLLFWQKASFEKEKFEKESMAARYESLKNQVSPHFLFNSLNALTNLVYEDQDKAVKFIKQLSEVYRYVLDTRDKEVVPITEELKFLESYLFLQHIRFGNKLTVNVSLPDDAAIKVAPLALQMLIENAIKHNIVSEADPLTISLYAEDGFLVVQNNLRKKSVTSERTSGVGLENIRKRYEYLSDKKVAIIEDERAFQVRLPILKENRT